jgi:hypothetical protein
MTSKIEIKTESLAERCEICHKTDCFDPKTNHCSRCAGAREILALKEQTALSAQPGRNLLPALLMPAIYFFCYGGYMAHRVYTESIVPYRDPELLKFWPALMGLEVVFFVFGIISLKRLIAFSRQAGAKQANESIFEAALGILFWPVSLLLILNFLIMLAWLLLFIIGGHDQF